MRCGFQGLSAQVRNVANGIASGRFTPQQKGGFMELSSDVEMQKVTGLAQEFFEKDLYDEEPAFVSDEATVFLLANGLCAR
jgi:hypothetical protein